MAGDIIEGDGPGLRNMVGTGEVRDEKAGERRGERAGDVIGVITGDCV